MEDNPNKSDTPLPCPEHTSYFSGCASCEDSILINSIECKHGQLSRSCEICELERERDEARHALRNVHKYLRVLDVPLLTALEFYIKNHSGEKSD